MNQTMAFTWKGLFYAAEAFLLILLSADFLSDGILPVDRAVGAWQRVKKVLVGIVLTVGSFYFFYQLASYEDSFELVPWIYALTVLLCYIHDSVLQEYRSMKNKHMPPSKRTAGKSLYLLSSRNDKSSAWLPAFESDSTMRSSPKRSRLI